MLNEVMYEPEDVFKPQLNGIVQLTDEDGNVGYYTTLLGKKMPIRVFRDIAVVNYKDLSELFEIDGDNLRRDFNNRRREFHEVLDFFMIGKKHICENAPYYSTGSSTPKILPQMHQQHL